MVGVTQEPESDLKLPTKNEWPYREQDIVNGNSDHRCNHTAAGKKRNAHGTEGLEPEDREEPEEDADGRSACNRMRRILGIQQFMELPDSLSYIAANHRRDGKG